MKAYISFLLLLRLYFVQAQEINNIISIADMSAKSYSKVSFKMMIPSESGENEMKQIGDYYLQAGQLVPDPMIPPAPEMTKLLLMVSEKLVMNPENLYCPVCHKDVGYAEQRMNKDSSIAMYSHEVMNLDECNGHKYEIRYTFVGKQLVKKIMVKSVFTGLKSQYCTQPASDFFKKIKDGESYLMEYWNGEDAPTICEEVNFQYQKLRFFYDAQGAFNSAQIINNQQLTNLAKNTDVAAYNDLGYEWQYDEDGLLVAIQAKADEDNLNVLYLIEYE